MQSEMIVKSLIQYIYVLTNLQKNCEQQLALK